MKNGYFDNEKNEFIITDMFPRRPLLNYLWNEEAVASADQFGSGFIWRSVGTGRRHIEDGDRNIYIKDKSTGEVYSANRNYNGLPFDKHLSHVGVGYQTVISEYNGLSCELTLTVPEHGAALLYGVKVKNMTEKKRELSIYFNVSPKPELSKHDAYGCADYSDSLGGLLYSHDGYKMPNEYTKVFVGSAKKPIAYEVSPSGFEGRYGGLHNPKGVRDERLSSRGSTFEARYTAAMQYDVTLGGGECFENVFCSFSARDEGECASLKDIYLADGFFSSELQKKKDEAKRLCEVYKLNSPDEYLNTQINVWLKHQISLGKTWGRLYGKGFRDVCQDITAFVSFDPSLARKRILYALTYQYEDGNPIRMFEPNYHFPYNDGGAWIPGAVLSYLNESGDVSILDEQVSYLEGGCIEHANYADCTFFTEPYTPGKRVDSVLCHVRAAVDYLLGDRGEHGLVLWRGGDWNDSMNSVGLLGRGESVWLSIATVKAVDEFCEILKIAGAYDEINAYREKNAELKSAIREHGYNGKHYIYGINDWGEKIGDTERIFLNAQSWAALAGIDDEATLRRAMDEVEKHLKCDFGYTQCYPSYDKGDLHIGRVSYFGKGLVENGGVYNHGVAFKIAADCVLGEGERAYRTLKLISCDNPKNDDSGVEPYAVTNMYIGPENPYLAGYAPASWITGTAGWIYRSVTEFLLGIKPTIRGLKVEPAMPSGWSGTSVSRKFRGETYNITYIESDRASLVCDGEEVDVLSLRGDGSVHEVICNYIKKEV